MKIEFDMKIEFNMKIKLEILRSNEMTLTCKLSALNLKF